MQVQLTSEATLASTTANWDDGGKPDSVPKLLSDTQVLVGGVAAPITSVGTNKIKFVMPWSAPTSGTTDIVVLRPSTGQILASSNVTMMAGTPSFFTTAGDGTGAILAYNADGTQNSATNAAKAGTTITLYCTGQGLVDNAPEDGVIPTADLPTADLPTVITTAGLVTASASYVASGEVNLWKVKFTIPSSAIGTVTVALSYKQSYSNQNGSGTRVLTNTIYVKQ
jgi:uncharacterized protein (TIGR03437 family)